MQEPVPTGGGGGSAYPEAGRLDPGTKMLSLFVLLLPAAPWKISPGWARCGVRVQTPPAPPPHASNIYSKSTFKGLFLSGKNQQAGGPQHQALSIARLDPVISPDRCGNAGGVSGS